jgi:CDP-glucose 4,6-dehydratase
MGKLLGMSSNQFPLAVNFRNKRVFVTGNTGFKGSWLSHWLLQMGAVVAGYSDNSKTEPSLYDDLNLSQRVTQYTGEISDFESVFKAVKEFNPDFIFHLAAQSIVSASIKSPRETFRTNTLGTVTVLEVIRVLEFKGPAILITSDKCYENDERPHGYHEEDRMGGKDPYSASKGAAEIAISSYVRTFLSYELGFKVGIGRAGNVIGGGDWNSNRIIVDCVRSWQSGSTVELRSPNSTRPWQHVLEPISGYLQLASLLSTGTVQSGEAFNFGPKEDSVFTVSQIVSKLAASWPNCPGFTASTSDSKVLMPEANLLSLNCDKARQLLAWESSLNLDECIHLISEWYLARQNKLDMQNITSQQISYFESKFEKNS